MPIKTVNQSILDAQMSHSIVVERFNMEINGRVQKILARNDRAVQALIVSGDLTKVKGLAKAAQVMINDAYDEVYKVYRSQLRTFVNNEVSFQSKVFNKQVGKELKVKRPSLLDVRKATLTTPLSVGDTNRRGFANHLRGLAKAEGKAIRQGVGLALTRGLSSKDAADFIYNSGEVVAPNKITRNQLRALVRTSITDVQSYSALATFNANKGIISKVKYLATLDARTSFVCQRLDGFVQENTASITRPPQHFNCRSVLVPIVDAYDNIAGKYKKKGITEAKRASMNGQVPTTESYNGWLRNAGELVQNSILGSTRAQAFRESNLRVEQMIKQDGRPLSVGAARRIDAEIADGQFENTIFGSGELLSNYDLQVAIPTKGQLFSKGNRSALLNYIYANSRSNTKFGRIDKKKDAGEDSYDPDSDAYDKDTISFDGRVYQEVKTRSIAYTNPKNKRGGVVKTGSKGNKYYPDGKVIITKSDLKSINEIVDELVNKSLIAGNQRTAVHYALRNLVAKYNGFELKGGRGSIANFKEIDPTKLFNEKNFTQILAEHLDNGRSATLQRLGRRRQAGKALTPPSEVIKNKTQRRKDIKRITKELRSNAAKPEIVAALSKELDSLGITYTGSLSNLSSDIAEHISRSLGNGAGGVARSLSRRLGITGGAAIIEPIGYRIIGLYQKELSTFRIVKQSRSTPRAEVNELRDVPNIDDLTKVELQKFKRDQVTYELAPESKAWIKLQNELNDERRYFTMPIKPGEVKSIKAGQRLDIASDRPFIKGEVAKDGILKPSKVDAASLEVQQSQTFIVNDKLASLYKIVADEIPTELGGNYFTSKGRFTGNWNALLDLVDYRATAGNKPFVLLRFLDDRHRKYSRGHLLNDQGDSFSRNLLLFEKEAKIDLDFQVRLEDQVTKAFGNRYGQTSKGISKKVYDEVYDDMLALGKAIETNDQVAMRRLTRRFLAQADEPGDLIPMAQMMYRRSIFKGAPSDFKTNWIPHADGSSNAFQQIGILTGDEKLLRATNLIDNSSGIKQQLYTDVGEELFSLPWIRKHPVLSKLDSSQNGKRAKTSLMAVAYGQRQFGISSGGGLTGTAGSLQRVIAKELGLTGKTRQVSFALKELGLDAKDLARLAKDFNNILDKQYPVVRAYNKYLQKYAEFSLDHSGTAEWIRPIHGDVVKSVYYKNKNTKVRNKLPDGTYFEQIVVEGTTEIDVNKTITSIIANFTHSIDSVPIDRRHLLKRKGTSLSTTHDSFSPSVDQLSRTITAIKQDMIDINLQDPLLNLITRGLAENQITKKQFDILFQDRIDFGLDPRSADAWKDFKQVLDSFYSFSA